MIKMENGERRYFDKNGVEITEGCTIKYNHGDKSLIRYEKVYRCEDGQLGTDSTKQSWIKSGRAIPCEYGLCPLTREDTESVEVVQN